MGVREQWQMRKKEPFNVMQGDERGFKEKSKSKDLTVNSLKTTASMGPY